MAKDYGHLHGIQEGEVRNKGHWHGDPALLGTPHAGPVGWMSGVDLEDCDECKAAQFENLHPIYRRTHIRENRFGGDLIEYGAITALFEEMPRAEVSVTSGAQSAFTAAKRFITEMVANQCKLAGCALSGDPYGVGDTHTEQCWFGMRQKLYRERAASHEHD